MLIIYYVAVLGAMSLLSFAAFVIDAFIARQSTRSARIPELCLLLLTGLGGAIGSGGAMLLFRHKTRKPSFCFTVVVSLLIQGAEALYIAF